MTNFETRDFLNSIQIASPCKASWEAMSGDEKVRFCQQCKLHVYNISEMSTAEANKVISTKSEGKRVCVRLFRRADGTVLTQDCPRGLRIIRERLGKVWQRVGVLTLWWLSFAAQARAQDADFEGPAPSRRASIRELLVSPKVPTIISNSEVDTRTMDRSNLDRQAIMGDVA